MRRHAPSVLVLFIALLLWAATSMAASHTAVPGTSLQALIDSAAAGDSIIVPSGTWRGSVTISKTLVIEGQTGAVIDGGGSGTVVRILAPNVTVKGFEIRGAGDDLSGPDAGIHVGKTAEGSLVSDNTVHTSAFGIWTHEVTKVRILKNRVIGTLEGHRTTRGNGIHLFDSDHLVVDGNHISGGRDGIYVSATEFTTISNNLMEQTRYGVHYMFSYDNVLVGNRSINNTNGYAVMGSRRVTVEDNLAKNNEHHGLLFRDVQYSPIRRNRLESNGEGLFFYSSTENTIVDNVIISNDVGAKIWAGSVRNIVSGNRFVGNRRQVFYVSSQDLVWGVKQAGNIWGDYLGWDQDGDGLGDRPYRVDSFTSHLLHKYPAAVLLMRSPALELMTHLQERMPVLKVATVVDMRPMMMRKGSSSTVPPGQEGQP